MRSSLFRAVAMPLVALVATVLSPPPPAVAAPTGAVAERADMRTATSKTWQLANGSMVAEMHAVPIHYQDSAGAWQDIDTTLGPPAAVGFGHSVLRNPAKLHFSDTARGRQGIEVDGSLFTFTAQTENDPQWLAQARYPVTVDPTVSLYTTYSEGYLTLTQYTLDGECDDQGIIWDPYIYGDMLQAYNHNCPGYNRYPCMIFGNLSPDPGIYRAQLILHGALTASSSRNFGLYISGGTPHAYHDEPLYLNVSTTWQTSGQQQVIYESAELTQVVVDYANMWQYGPYYIPVYDLEEDSPDGNAVLDIVAFDGQPATEGPELLVYYDATPPTCTVTPNGGATNDNPIAFTITFSETLIDALAIEDITVTGGSGGLTQNTNTTYTLSVTPNDGCEVVAVQVAAGAVHDVANNGNTAGSAQVQFDSVQPILTIDKPAGNELHIAASGATFALEGTVSDECSGVHLLKVEIDGGQWHDPDNWVGSTWQENWANITAGTHVIGVQATDNAGNIAEIYRPITVTLASVVFLKADGSNYLDGSTRALAKRTLANTLEGQPPQSRLGAIDQALQASPPSEIWVAEVTQSPYHYQESDTIYVPDGVALYGGFTTNEDVREERDWSANETILDGAGGHSVVTVSCTDPNTRIDGFTVQNGLASRGGGIYCGGGPTIVHNKIRENTATDAGGGIYCNTASATIKNNVISDNKVTGEQYGGGGVACDVSASNIRNNAIVGNRAYRGAGLYCEGGMVGVGDCQIVNNTIACSGVEQQTECGGVYISRTDPLLSNCIVAHNQGAGVKGVNNAAPTLRCNDVHGNGTNYSGVSPGTGDISDDPVLLGDCYHIDPDDSPCIDEGNDDDVDPMEEDIDDDPRIQGEHVDIGADETPGAAYEPTLELTADPCMLCVNGTSIITAFVHKGHNLVGGIEVAFTVTGKPDGAAATVNPGYSTTHPGAGTQLTCDKEGWVIVQATAAVEGNPTATVTVLFFECPPAAGQDWPMFMHDPLHTGTSPDPDKTAETLTFGWSASVPTATAARAGWSPHPNRPGGGTLIFPHPYIDSSPVHAAECPVIIGAWGGGEYGDPSTTGFVKAFGPLSNTERWRYPSNPSQFIGAVASTPCVADIGGVKRVYFGSMDGKAYCLNAQTGQWIWEYQTAASELENVEEEVEGARVLASPTVYNGRVYIGNESATLYCLDAADGSPKWSLTFARDSNWPDRTGVSSVAMGYVGQVLRAYVGCDNGHVYCLSTADNPPDPPGRVLWDYDASACVESSPTFYYGHVFVGATWYGGTDLVALDAETGEPTWSRALGEEIRATPAASKDHLFVGEDTGNCFYRLDVSTGGRDPDAYTNPLNASAHPPDPAGACDFFVGSAGLTAGGLCIVGNDNYALYALSASDLTLQTPETVGTGGVVCSSPAISYAAESGYRWVYILSRADGGTLLAYRQELE